MTLVRPTWALGLATALCLAGCKPQATPPSTGPAESMANEASTSATRLPELNGSFAEGYPNGYPMGGSYSLPSTAYPEPHASSTPTSAPTETPTPTPVHSSLFVDSAVERVYGSITSFNSADLLIYNAKDAQLVERRSLEAGEGLLGLDDVHRRLYLYRPDRGMRILDADRFDTVANMLMSTPAPLNAEPFPGIDLSPVKPLILPKTGEILTFHDLTVTAFDPVSGKPAWDFELDLLGERGPISRAAASADGRLLYLAVISRAFVDLEKGPGLIVAAVDLPKGTVRERRGFGAQAYGWFAWDDNLILSTDVLKDIGLRHSLWLAGRERTQLFESNLQWTAYDARRDRLIGFAGAYRHEDWPSVVTADPQTLDLITVHQKVSAKAPIAYDPGSDQLIAWSDQTDHLDTIPAASLTNNPIDQLTSVQPISLTGRTGLPMSLSFDTDATLFSAEDGTGVLRSRDAGLSWSPVTAGLTNLSFMDVVTSPNFAKDRTVVATTFQGMQSYWQPTHSSQPHPRREAIPAATPPESTAWRTRDAGDHWVPIGSYSAVTFAPAYPGDRTMMAFGYLDTQFYISQDGGDHWAPRGQIPATGENSDGKNWDLVGTYLWTLPRNARRPRIVMALGTSYSQIGGVPHWPESGAMIFRSVDDGWHWELAWDGGRGASALNGTLLGPISGDSGGQSSWILDLPWSSILISRDDGLSWVPNQIADGAETRPIAVMPNGMIMVSDPDSGGPREVPLTAFKDIPTPTPDD